MTKRQLQYRGWKLTLINQDDLGGDREGSCWDATFYNSKTNQIIDLQIDTDTSVKFDGLRWCRTIATEQAWEKLITRLEKQIPCHHFDEIEWDKLKEAK